MRDDEQDPFDTYTVVINHEEQYSIWPVGKTMPSGWQPAGKEGPKQECLDYINTIWTDMRPASLRKQMEEWEKNLPPPAEVPEPDPLPPLVDRLSDGDHKVIFNCRPERTAKALKERIDMGYVHVKFT